MDGEGDGEVTMMDGEVTVAQNGNGNGTKS